MLNERLRELRTEHHMTQAEVADLLGMDRTSYTYYEIGKTSPSPKTLIKLARMYRITVGYLLGVEDNHPECMRDTPPENLTTITDPIALLSRDERKMVLCLRMLNEQDKKAFVQQLLEKTGAR